MPSKARLEIQEQAGDWHRLIMTRGPVEKGAFYYTLDFEADEFENGDPPMEPEHMDGLEWPPKKTDGRFRVVGEAHVSADTFRAKNLKSVRISVITKPERNVVSGEAAKHFKVVFQNRKRVTLARKRTDYKLWRGPLGIEPHLRPAFVYNGLAFLKQMSPMFS